MADTSPARTGLGLALSALWRLPMAEPPVNEGGRGVFDAEACSSGGGGKLRLDMRGVSSAVRCLSPPPPPLALAVAAAALWLSTGEVAAERHTDSPSWNEGISADPIEAKDECREVTMGESKTGVFATDELALRLALALAFECECGPRLRLASCTAEDASGECRYPKRGCTRRPDDDANCSIGASSLSSWYASRLRLGEGAIGSIFFAADLLFK
jgi:hypothetical protein